MVCRHFPSAGMLVSPFIQYVVSVSDCLLLIFSWSWLEKLKSAPYCPQTSSYTVEAKRDADNSVWIKGSTCNLHFFLLQHDTNCDIRWVSSLTSHTRLHNQNKQHAHCHLMMAVCMLFLASVLCKDGWCLLCKLSCFCDQKILHCIDCNLKCKAFTKHWSLISYEAVIKVKGCWCRDCC